MLAPSITYATPNQSATENFTNTTNVSEIAENTTNAPIIQNTTTNVVNDTETNQPKNQTSENSNIQNSSSDNSNGTDTIQNYTAAASDGIYINVRGLWLNVDDVNNVDVNELLTAGITDVFVKANRFSTPTYQTVLTTIINKLQGTGIRIHAWVTCFIDANGNWVDPQDSDYTDALVKSIANITTNYNIAGIHLDYVRYPGTAYKHTGGTAAITSFVQEVYGTVKSIKAKVAVSAALMPECTANAYYYGQDYEALSNYLDFLVPMIYKGNYNEDTEWIATTTAYIVSHSSKPVIAGLQTYESDSNLVALSAEEVGEDMESAISGGASGFALFRYGWLDKSFYNQTTNNAPKSFTSAQVVDAAVRVKAYIEANNKLPSTVNINGTTVGIYTFLELATTAVQHLYSNNPSLIEALSFNDPQIIREEIHAGNMDLVEYIKIADQVKVYMDKVRYVPGYACQTSLGPYFGHQSMIYMYSKILDYYNTNKVLPNTVSVKPWKVVSDPNAAGFTNDQVSIAASSVKAYIEANNKLPSTVNINGTTVGIYTFLELATTAVQNIYSNNPSLIEILSFNGPQILREEIHAGNMDLVEYIKIADQVKVYMDKTRYVPGYATSTSLGPYLGYQSMIYMYSKILDYYNTNNVLPNYVSVKPWNGFTIDQVASAATNVKTFIKNNQRLPEYVTINGLNVGMPSFLELLTTAVLQVNNGNTASIDYNIFGSPQSPTEQVNSGNLNKNEYIELASRIKSYMDSNGVAPNYGSSTLGKIRYESLIDIYSRILSYYSTNRVLPNYASVKPWSSGTTPDPTIPSELQKYLQPTSNCQSNDQSIISKANSICSGATSSYEKAQRIFNWVRDNIEYSYYYNTQKGAVNTLSSRSANCCDHSHLIVALSRAAGLPARYVHGECTFTSGNVYGHVWAQIYANGQWYIADATSSRNDLGVIRNWNTDSWTYKGTYSELPF